MSVSTSLGKLEFRDGFPKGSSYSYVGQCLIKGPTREAQGGGPHRSPEHVESAESNFQPLTFFSYEGFPRDATVYERDSSQRMWSDCLDSLSDSSVQDCQHRRLPPENCPYPFLEIGRKQRRNLLILRLKSRS